LCFEGSFQMPHKPHLYEATVPPARIRELFDYDPLTGSLTRRSTGYVFVKRRYALVRIDGKNRAAARVIWCHVHGRWPSPGMDIDHINCDPSDNRLSNLREATFIQNLANRRAQGGRRFKGITRVNKRWQAQIRHEGRNIYLGLFDTAEEAHAAYMAKAKELHGEFARAA
jgi:hypothetical protein